MSYLITLKSKDSEPLKYYIHQLIYIQIQIHICIYEIIFLHINKIILLLLYLIYSIYDYVKQIKL